MERGNNQQGILSIAQSLGPTRYFALTVAASVYCVLCHVYVLTYPSTRVHLQLVLLLRANRLQTLHISGQLLHFVWIHSVQQVPCWQHNVTGGTLINQKTGAEYCCV